MSGKEERKNYKETVIENLAYLTREHFEKLEGEGSASVLGWEAGLAWFSKEIFDGRASKLLSHEGVLKGFFDLVLSNDPDREREGVRVLHALLDVGAGEKVAAAKGCKAVVEKLMKKPFNTQAGKAGRELNEYLEAARRSAPPVPKERQAVLRQG
ncbi:MAG: hypothetical protein PHY92_02300 [Alphaproteobacteria bacterium]|nr:hypothetical protein [Alphaproteobacteria bacterium]